MQVDLAVKILDGSYFRAGESKPLSVQPAKFEMHGDFVAKKRGNAKKRKKLLQQNEEKTLGWGGFDDKFKDTEVSSKTFRVKGRRACTGRSEHASLIIVELGLLFPALLQRAAGRSLQAHLVEDLVMMLSAEVARCVKTLAMRSFSAAGRLGRINVESCRRPPLGDGGS